MVSYIHAFLTKALCRGNRLVVHSGRFIPGLLVAYFTERLLVKRKQNKLIKILFIHQLMHNIKIYIKTAPTCFGNTVTTVTLVSTN